MGEEKLDKILGMMTSLSQEIKDMKTEHREFINIMKVIVQENEEIKKENAELKRNLKEIGNKIEAIEKEKRKDNILIQGIEVDGRDRQQLKGEIANFIKVNMGMEVEINTAIKIGHKTCLVELKDKNEKEKVMKNKNKLRNYRKGRVYINEDLTKQEREIERILRTKAREELQKGNDVKRGHQRLFINGTAWKWDMDSGNLKIVGGTITKNPKNEKNR